MRDRRERDSDERTLLDRARATVGRIGVLLHVVAVLALPVLAFALIDGDMTSASGLGLCFGLSLVLAQGLYRLGRGAAEEAIPTHVVAAGWLLIAVLGAIPFAWVGAAEGYGGPSDWLFEGMSGATSTGLTLAENPSALPRSIQLWRTLLEWAGGLGFAVLTLALLKPSEREGYDMYLAEARSTQFGDVQHTARHLIVIYLVYSALAVVALALTGIDLWEALNHGLVAIGTGGFTVTEHSFADYGVATHLVAMAIMLTGATTFIVHHRLFYERRLSALLNRQLLTMLGMWLVGGAILALSEANRWEVVDVLFNWTSAVTTTGFSARPPIESSEAFMLWLIVAMLIGGCAGSTAGGLKIERLRRAARSVAQRLVRIRRGEEATEPEEQELTMVRAARHSALGQVALVLATWWVGALLLAWSIPHDVGADLVLFETASAIGGVGLSAGITSADLPWTSKLLMTALMWLGRLEIVPVLILVWRLGAVARHGTRAARIDKERDAGARTSEPARET